MKHALSPKLCHRSITNKYKRINKKLGNEDTKTRRMKQERGNRKQEHKKRVPNKSFKKVWIISYDIMDIRA